MTSWRIIGASVAGALHIEAGRGCDDTHGWFVGEELSVLVVADGAGSKPGTSVIGSRTAVRAVLAAAQEAEFTQRYRRGPLLAAQGLMDVAALAVTQMAASRSVSPSELATTLCVAVLDEAQVTVLQIGDGVAVVEHSDGRAEHVAIAEAFEYANETVFLTHAAFRRHVQKAQFPAGEISGIALSTDGLQYKLLDLGTQTPFERFYAQSWAAARDVSASSEAIEHFLQEVDDQTGDDLTLVLAVNNYAGAPGEGLRLPEPAAWPTDRGEATAIESALPVRSGKPLSNGRDEANQGEGLPPLGPDRALDTATKRPLPEPAATSRGIDTPIPQRLKRAVSHPGGSPPATVDRAATSHGVEPSRASTQPPPRTEASTAPRPAGRTPARRVRSPHARPARQWGGCILVFCGAAIAAVVLLTAGSATHRSRTSRGRRGTAQASPRRPAGSSARPQATLVGGAAPPLAAGTLVELPASPLASLPALLSPAVNRTGSLVPAGASPAGASPARGRLSPLVVGGVQLVSIRNGPTVRSGALIGGAVVPPGRNVRRRLFVVAAPGAERAVRVATMTAGAPTDLTAFGVGDLVRVEARSPSPIAYALHGSASAQSAPLAVGVLRPDEPATVLTDSSASGELLCLYQPASTVATPAMSCFNVPRAVVRLTFTPATAASRNPRS